MFRIFSAGAERCVANGKIVVRPIETSDRCLRCGRNKVASRYFVISNGLCERFRLVRLVKMLGSVRLYMGKDARFVDDRSRLMDSKSGSGSLSKYSLAGDGSADDSLSDEVDEARDDTVWVSVARSNSETDGRELVEVDLDVEAVMENGMDSREGVLGARGLLSIALGVLSTSLERVVEVRLVAEP